MKIRFWGVRGSIPSPGPHTWRYGGNTPCVEVQLSDGAELVLDAKAAHEITPTGGVPHAQNHFLFTPTDAAFPTPAKTDKDYWVLAQVLAQGVTFAENRSAGKLHVGAGGIHFTVPETDIDALTKPMESAAAATNADAGISRRRNGSRSSNA